MELKKETSSSKQLRCRRCGHIWDYKGNNPYICSCPYCRTTVSLNKCLKEMKK